MHHVIEAWRAVTERRVGAARAAARLCAARDKETRHARWGLWCAATHAAIAARALDEASERVLRVLRVFSRAKLSGLVAAWRDDTVTCMTERDLTERVRRDDGVLSAPWRRSAETNIFRTQGSSGQRCN